MTVTTTRRLAATGAAVALLAAVPAPAAVAAPESGAPLRAFSLVLEGDQAVCDFAVRVQGKDARVVTQTTVGSTTTTTGSGYTLTFSRVDDPSTSVTYESAPFTEVRTTLRNGSTRIETEGSTAVLLFEGDRSRVREQPDGPSAFIWQGTTVYLDTATVDTLESAEGTGTDVCAALS